MVLLALLWLALACADEPPMPPPPPPPMVLPGCPCTLAPAEDCTACFQLIGRCCYEDATIEGQAGALSDTCESDERCRSCCDECAALSCDQLKSMGNCVNLAPP